MELLDLFVAIQKAWSRETSADSEHWSTENPAWGQCAATALVVQDFLGGKLMRMNLSSSQYPEVAAMRSHYFNRVPMKFGNPEDVDFTKSQFQDQNEYSKLRRSAIMIPREYLLPENPLAGQLKFKARYKALSLEVARILSNNSPVFENPIYKDRLALALESNCAKGK